MKTVIKCTDGSVAVMTLVDGADLSESLRKWGDVNPGKYLSHRDMPDEAIPTDRTFREAWADTTPELVIDVDMPKARSIHLNRIREKRNAELSRLDIESIKAQDINDNATLQTIRARKQELRDLPTTITPQINAALTPDDLKLVQPL